jgi:hypothetical protein
MSGNPKRGGARPGSGPKPKPPEERRTEQLRIRLTADEKRRIVEAFGPRDVSGEAREALLAEADRRLES